MAKPKLPLDVKLFIAVTFSDDNIFEKIKIILQREFGAIDCLSAIFSFDYTKYYVREMGEGLKKQLLSFEQLISPDSLPEIKLRTNEIEDQFSVNGKRRVNLDPGYLSAAKVVMATAKNFDHRIYLGKGIYGDVQLRYRKNKFHFNPWTYPDYKDKYIIDFLARTRKIYMKEFDKLMREREKKTNHSVSYKDAGVDIEAGEESVKEISRLAKSTFSSAVLRDIGLFGSFYQLNNEKYKEPVLVSSVDGVGTKLKVAFMARVFDTVGEDLVNHCVNDIMTSGADPLFFLDYLAFANLDQSVLVEIMKGFARGCCNAQCSLIGGETAEMPGFYQQGEFDISGTIVGIVEKENIIDGKKIKSGDVLIALPSNGLHTNGYSLVRKVFFEVQNFSIDQYIPELQKTVAEELLRVHRCYQKAINAVKLKSYLHGMAHITGGGIEGNAKRLLKNGLELKIDWDSWEIPLIFQFIQSSGNIELSEMRRVFNLGVGFVFVVDKNHAGTAISDLQNSGEKPFIIGEIE